MKTRTRRSLMLAAIALSTFAPAADAGTPGAVSVRVEGASETRVPAMRVETSATPVTVTDPGTGATTTCSGTSALAALHAATGGDWSGRILSFGTTIDVVTGESHGVASGERFWSFWVNDQPATVGACDQQLEPGDRVLFFVGCVSATSGCVSSGALLSTVPAIARPGAPVSLLVEQADAGYDAEWNPTYARGASAGARVTVAGTSATTAADGSATVTLGDARGPQRIVVEKAGYARFSASICVTDGADGACGSIKPIPGITAREGDACVHHRNDGRCGTPDLTPPVVRLIGLEHGKRYRRAQAPRTLAGVAANWPRGARVADASGLKEIRLRITRERGKRCAYLDGDRERWRPLRSCKPGKGRSFAVGATTVEWEYALPVRLGQGRYRVEAFAIDGKGNTLRTRMTGTNHYRFSVR